MIRRASWDLRFVYLVFVMALLVLGCTTQMKITVDRGDAQQNLQPKPVGQEIKVIEADDALPQNALFIAKLKVTDTGVTVDCGYDNVLAQALDKARELGGDLVQIMQVYEPDLWSSCFRLEVDVYVLQ